MTLEKISIKKDIVTRIQPTKQDFKNGESRRIICSAAKTYIMANKIPCTKIISRKRLRSSGHFETSGGIRLRISSAKSTFE